MKCSLLVWRMLKAGRVEIYAKDSVPKLMRDTRIGTWKWVESVMIFYRKLR
jgi:hypothetical protein